MPNPAPYCATDKEVYDLLMSSPQSLTPLVLLKLARKRGIFYSPKESRETLASNLSLLPHDHADVDAMLDLRAGNARTEKLTSITLKTAVSMEDVKAISTQYKEQATSDETIIVNQEGTNKYTVKVTYSELDYKKTRLLQRRVKDADIEFLIKDGETTIRMPANVKAKEITAILKSALDARAKQNLPTQVIELTNLRTPEARTTFFTSLISEFIGYQLVDITDLKIDSRMQPATDLDMDDPAEAGEIDDLDTTDIAAKEAMLAVVHNIVLKGRSLLASKQYQQLRQQGFYITSITWKSRQTEHPYNIIEYEAGFDVPREGKGFRYNVRGMYRYINGEHTATLRPLNHDERAPLLQALEMTARKVLNQLEDHPPKTPQGVTEPE